MQHAINRIIVMVKQQSHAIAIVLEIAQPYYISYVSDIR